VKPILVTFLLLGCCADAVNAQEAKEAPACDSSRLQKTLTEAPEKLLVKQRFCLYGSKLVTGQAVFGAAFFSGVAQFRDDPVEWGQGTEGYARRFGARYTQGMAKTTGEFVSSWIAREDPRYDLSQDRSFWGRTGHTFARMVVVENLDGNTRPAYSKFAGAASSGLVGLAWYPDRLNRPVDVASRSASAFGGYLASNMFQEFKPDLLNILGKMFGKNRNTSSKPGASAESK
jgi:hypothetical protein